VEGIHSHTDMGLLVNAGIPTVNFGPGSPYLAHQDNEWLALEDLERATLGMLAMALTWCGGAIP
jgi:acetylornithine deacetylase